MPLPITGRLGAIDSLGDSTNRDVYTVPANRNASVNITLVNRTNANTEVFIAHIKAGTSGAISAVDYLICNLPTSSLAHNQAPVSITGIMMGAGDTISTLSTASACTVQVNGIEED
ncbi:MAG: hypothetical protein GY738_17275 [Pseudoalteromonas sp.]|nr:hypothetical protein [Pseudoalteromonas sp.]